MASCSVGILMYRLVAEGAEVLLVHPGGPFWQRKDLGAWSIPKGEPQPGETAQETARREFAEELGTVPPGPLVPLGRIRQRGGKVVEAFALRGDLEAEKLRCSSEVELEWPRGSGQIRRFPEIDRAAWFSLPEARLRILAAQGELLERLEHELSNKNA
ncbi:NUDIX domain-containing protein (plasmid) [Bosea sp. F3-2]|uniref:NUDIX domain-containing protein n=1 Tax=Bosea sp. F3-2 TaxID=2599640 RepID=UPI0011F059FE|nr:NUDIX domain-containing protein [Bosea sp. F3-2]QEL27190.1 NUDIX domain-containing protein [Bosea sp. F3-2]